MRGIKDKMIAAGSTVLFMAIINTNAEPRMWQIALVGILMYETALCFLRTYRRKEVQRKYDANMVAGREDMRRVQDIVFNYLRTMKEVG